MSLTSELNLWYLDEVTLGGPADVVLKDLSRIIEKSAELGLKLNFKKCEIAVLASTAIGADQNLLEPFQQLAPGIRILNKGEMVLLGSPLTEEAISVVLQVKTNALSQLKSRLDLIPAHCALFLLRNSLAIPRLVYVLRTSTSWECPAVLEAFDNELKAALESICNTALDEASWLQSSLPVRNGGLGIRHAKALALPAFLASAASVSNLTLSILPEYVGAYGDEKFSEGSRNWWDQTKSPIPAVEDMKYQSSWETPLSEKSMAHLSSLQTGILDKARLLSVTSNESGAWLEAAPISSLGTLLDDDSLRIAIALRLGAKICVPHNCVSCGSPVDASGIHGLCCRFSAGRRARHAAVNDLIHRALTSADIPTILEPAGTSRDNGKRPDGLSLVPWKGGKPLVWDFTCTDTFATSNLANSYTVSGSAAASAEHRKNMKYRGLKENFHFIAVGIETLGACGPEAKALLKEIGKRLTKSTGEPRSSSFLMQRVSVAVQRGNAASVLGTLPNGRSFKELFLL